MCDGSGLNRVQAFLLKTLHTSTQTKYQQALDHLNCDLRVAGLKWGLMDEEDQDVLEAFEAGKSRSDCGLALSAVQKVNYRIAWGLESL